MTASLAPMTRLDAVNDMLLSIGQGTINSLAAAEGVDAANAVIALGTTSREVQERGWYFNRDHDYKLVPDTAGVIALPENCLEFAPRADWRRVVERARKLYDRENHTFTFAAGTTVYGSVTWLFEFEELPQAARTYIHRKAGRMFQIGAVGSDLLYKFTREMEEEALTALTRSHLRAEKPNAIYDNAQTYRTVYGGRTPRSY